MPSTTGREAMRVRTMLLAAALMAGALAACTEQRRDDEAMNLANGNPEHGQQLVAHYGCGSCHTIPGIPGARTDVAPPLVGIAGRAYIAGVLPNTPDNMVDWIHNPPAVDSKTAMPDLGVSKAEARDIAAYLYTLR